MKSPIIPQTTALTFLLMPVVILSAPPDLVDRIIIIRVGQQHPSQPHRRTISFNFLVYLECQFNGKTIRPSVNGCSFVVFSGKFPIKHYLGALLLVEKP